MSYRCVFPFTHVVASSVVCAFWLLSIIESTHKQAVILLLIKMLNSGLLKLVVFLSLLLYFNGVLDTCDVGSIVCSLSCTRRSALLCSGFLNLALSVFLYESHLIGFCDVGEMFHLRTSHINGLC